MATGPGDPPSLSEPLIRLGSSGIQSAIAWVHNVVTSLAANIEADRERQSQTEAELRTEDKQLRERLQRLEAVIESSNLAEQGSARLGSDVEAVSEGTLGEISKRLAALETVVSPSGEVTLSQRLATLETGMGSAASVGGDAAKEYAAELKQHGERSRFLEEQLENLQQMLAQRFDAQEEQTKTRLETIERDLLSCVRAADLDKLRSEVDEQTNTPVQTLRFELHGALQTHTDTLQKDLKSVSDTINAKLGVVDEQLEAVSRGGTNNDGSGEGSAGSAQVAMATAKLKGQIGELETRIVELEGMRDLNLEGRVRELEALRTLLDQRALDAEENAVRRAALPPTTECLESDRGLNIDGSQLLLGTEDGVDMVSGGSPANSANPAASCSISPSHQGQDFAELASRVDGALDGMSKRLYEMEQQVETRLTQAASTSDPNSPAAASAPSGPGAEAAVEMLGVPSQLSGLAKHVDTSLSDMSRRIAALEEAENAALEAALSAEEAKQLVAEAAEAAATQAAVPPASLLTEFSNRMDETLSDVSNRIGNLEKKVGEIAEPWSCTPEEEKVLVSKATGVQTLVKGLLEDKPWSEMLAKKLDINLAIKPTELIALKDMEEFLQEVKNVLQGLGQLQEAVSDEDDDDVREMKASFENFVKDMDELNKSVEDLQQDFTKACQAVPPSVGLPAGGAPQEALLGELASRVDAQLDVLQRKISTLEQLAERRPQSSGSQNGGGQVGIPTNILEGLQHELESAKARIELQLGQELDAKTAALERRLAETVASSPNPWGSVVEALEGRVLEVEATVGALRSAVESGEAAAESRDAARTSREIVFDEVAPPECEIVSPEQFRTLSEKVELLDPQLRQAMSTADQAVSAAHEVAAAAAAAASEAAKQKTLAERQQEARLNSMWSELSAVTEAGAVRGDAVEKNLMTRIETIESSVVNMNTDLKKADQSLEYKKSMEWMNWRISWLEWATGGEKRSFARPIDSKAVFPSPPPATIAAACFSQPITEDVELWARDRKTGQQRLRRDLNTGAKYTDYTPKGNSASLGRLPRLTQ